MKRGLAAAFGIIAAAAATGAPVADAAKHSVMFTAKATGLRTQDKAEFLFVTPDSDHDYEAVFKLDDSAKDIVAALNAAGIPRGRDFDVKTCRLWPVGVILTLEPAITNFVRDAYGEALAPIVYTGGKPGEKGVPDSDAESPCAFFAMYNCPQSQLQFDASLEQTPTYGRFAPAKEFGKGESFTFTLSWNGSQSVKPLDLKLAPGKAADAVALLKEKSAESELDVLADFDPDLTLREASEFSEVLRMLDSARVKINGFKDGQFFFRAFLPLEKWRDRKERLAQPPEIHFKSDGFVVTEIIEDWSDESSIDPKLTIIDHPSATLADVAKFAKPIGEKTYTVFIYAPAETKLSKLYEVKRALESDLIWNWYVFTENDTPNPQ